MALSFKALVAIATVVFQPTLATADLAEISDQVSKGDGESPDMDMGSGAHSMDTGTMPMGCGDLTCPSSQAFIDENTAMHSSMAIHFTCDVNVDFARGMVRNVFISISTHRVHTGSACTFLGIP
jgi:hypothetical protein